jgi:outer membrane protein assembly factor BamD (BamD/ComL family)
MGYRIRDTNPSFPSEHPELLSRSERIWLFAEQHRGAVIMGALLFCAAAVAIGVIFWWQHQQEQKALVLEHRAAQLYLDRSLDEPDKAKENLSKAITLYEEILEEYPRSSSAELSWYFLGNARAEGENYPGAIEAYEKYISSFRNNPALLGLVFQRLGSTYILNGQRQKGMEAYSQALNVTGALNKDQIIFEMAKLEEAEDQTEQALTHFKLLQDQYPASPYVNEAIMRIRVLEPPKEIPQDIEGKDTTSNGEENIASEKKD